VSSRIEKSVSDTENQEGISRKKRRFAKGSAFNAELSGRPIQLGLPPLNHLLEGNYIYIFLTLFIIIKRDKGGPSGKCLPQPRMQNQFIIALCPMKSFSSLRNSKSLGG
jgi:hypothetical protein